MKHINNLIFKSHPLFNGTDQEPTLFFARHTFENGHQASVVSGSIEGDEGIFPSKYILEIWRSTEEFPLQCSAMDEVDSLLEELSHMPAEAEKCGFVYEDGDGF